MKRLFISFFAVSIFISCSVFAQTSLIDKLKENSQKACGTGEFTSADSLNYGIDWKSTDPNVTIGDSALAKALGSTKSEYLLTACVSGTDAKVTLYIKYTQTTDKIFMASYSGKVAEGGTAALKTFSLNDGDVTVVWSYGPDKNKQFSKDINKFSITLIKDKLSLDIEESFYIQGKRFKEEAGVDAIKRQEIIIPELAAGDPEDDDDNVKVDDSKTMPKKIETVGYTYSMVFIDVEADSNKLTPFLPEDLKSQGVTFSAIDNFPKDKQILLAMFGVLVKADHIELDVFALLKDPIGGDVDLYDFTQSMYSVKTLVRGSKTEKGGLDEIVLLFESGTTNKSSSLMWRKATKGGLDIINVAIGGKSKTYSGSPWAAKDADISLFAAKKTKIDFNSTFMNTTDTKEMSITDDFSKVELAGAKIKINSMEKKWVKELLDK